MSRWSGYVVVLCILCAAAIPLAQLVRTRRLAPTAPAMNAHAALGLGVSALAFFHVVAAIPALGESSVVEGGMTALLPGVLGFFVLVAHTGVGLQLRQPKLRERPSKRVVHRITATLVVLAVAAHVVLLRAT